MKKVMNMKVDGLVDRYKDMDKMCLSSDMTADDRDRWKKRTCILYRPQQVG